MDIVTLGVALNNTASKVNGLLEDVRLKSQPNKNSGYYWAGEQSNNSYFYWHIEVEAGDVISITADDVLQNIRFIDAYNNTTRVASACVNGNTKSYTVPNGVNNIYLSINFNPNYYNIYTIVTVRKGVKGMDDLAEELHIVNSQSKNGSIFITANSLSTNGTLELTQHADVKKNKSFRFFAKFSSFDSVTVGQGKNKHGGSWATIDSTYITTYYYNGSAVQMGQYEHGLTISDFIDIIITVGQDKNSRGSITIMSIDGDFTQNQIAMSGCSGGIFATGTQAMTNIKFGTTLHDLKSDVWIFGDSYLSLGDPNRMGYQLMDYGYENVALLGYSGATTIDGLLAFNETTAIRLPKTVVWALGMNNPDSGAINAQWLSDTQKVMDFCEKNNIELILCTIPNVPSHDHTYKNAYVKSSGYRYVDYSLDVNTTGTECYTGMLSSDNEHHTTLGAKALVNQLLISVPAITK